MSYSSAYQLMYKYTHQEDTREFVGL